MNNLLFCVISSFLLNQSPRVLGVENYRSTVDSYCNARYRYCIQYPPNILTPQREAGNGDGREFKNRQGKVILTVFGRINEDINGKIIPLKKQFASDLKELKEGGSLITYKKMGMDFYVISGTNKGKTFYNKMVAKRNAFCFALLEYENTEKSIYDKYTKVIFSSFY